MRMERCGMMRYLDPLRRDYHKLEGRDGQRSRQVDEVTGCDRGHDHASSDNQVWRHGQINGFTRVLFLLCLEKHFTFNC